MIRNISLLLILLLANACATSHSSQFSKRKHLKGHFWNLKEKHKSSDSNSDAEDDSALKEDRNKSQSSEQTQTTPIEINELESASEEIAVNEEREEPRFESIEDFESPNDYTSTTPQKDNRVVTNEHKRQKVRPSKAEITFAVIIVILLGLIFWAGVIGLIVSLFMHINSAIIPWVFYTSLIVVVLPILLILGFIIVESVFNS